jgi:hypothetical protein
VFSTKNREQEGKTGPAWGEGMRRRREAIKKECTTVNMVEILCSHVYKWKSETC